MIILLISWNLKSSGGLVIYAFIALLIVYKIWQFYKENKRYNKELEKRRLELLQAKANVENTEVVWLTPITFKIYSTRCDCYYKSQLARYPVLNCCSSDCTWLKDTQQFCIDLHKCFIVHYIYGPKGKQEQTPSAVG